MGLFDKIKNALFEEEYVEIEEKPKKPKKEVLKKETIKKEIERPIAKKVLLPKKEEPKIEELDEAEYLDEDFEIQPKMEVVEEKNDFKIMDDEDFRVEETRSVKVTEPQIVKVLKKEEPPVKEEVHYYQPKKEKLPYGIDDKSRISVPEYGRSNDISHYSSIYERKDEKKNFKPSPIISPIYGILDKNYRKEDVVAKKEVRSTNVTPKVVKENLSLDEVRKKAYGSNKDLTVEDLLENEMGVDSFDDDKASVNISDDNLLVDLTSDVDKPAVKEVTMGDALEYFEDLGLEYNVDYVDASKDMATGRRSKDNYDDIPQITQEIKLDEVIDADKEVNRDVNVEADDNLFDLIDSMYKENE